MRTHEETPEECYQNFWKDIVEKDGVVDMEAVKNELYDCHTMIQEVPKVYCDLTGGRVSKPNTMAFEVIREAEAHFRRCEKSVALEDIEDMAKYAKTVEELMEEIRDYLAEEDWTTNKPLS